MKSYLEKFYLILSLLMLIVYQTAFAQPKTTSPNAFGEKEIVTWDYHSKIIGEDYTLYVHFPPGYDTTKKSYPVLYMTDGDWNMTVAMNCFRMLRQDYTTTEPLIIGIGYGNHENKRNRDFEPTAGGPKFISFIKEEIMPFVQTTYRVTDNKSLYGYSYGGVFAAYVLFHYPGLFNNICIGAPGNADLTPQAEKYFASHQEMKGKLYLGVGSYENGTVARLEDFKRYMIGKNLPDLKVSSAIAPKAGHGAALGQVMMSGMKFLYCVTHQPVTLSMADLKRFTGKYDQGAQKDPLKIYLQNDRLYIENKNGSPTELVPFSREGLFVYENKKMDIYFKEEGQHQFLLIDSHDEKTERLNKLAVK